MEGWARGPDDAVELEAASDITEEMPAEAAERSEGMAAVRRLVV